MNRGLADDGSDEHYVADITSVPTWQAFLFLAVVIDASGRRVVGPAIALQTRMEPVVSSG